MKIYFAGSIRGGRALAELYARMIAFLQRTDTVLTEHVGELALEESASDADIYARDMAWLNCADMLIAECTCPSLGVGYELARAEARGIPCHIFYDRRATQLSAMLTGSGAFNIHPYGDEGELFETLRRIMEAAAR